MTYRNGGQPSRGGVDLELVVLGHDGVLDLTGRTVAVGVGRKHLDHSSP